MLTAVDQRSREAGQMHLDLRRSVVPVATPADLDPLGARRDLQPDRPECRRGRAEAQYLATVKPARRNSGADNQAVAFLAITLAMINVIGGYMVTDRMLGSFKKKEKK